MSIFRKSKKFKISERDPKYNVKYLGNVQTTLMKGDGCTDKPSGVLWNNFVKTGISGLDMELRICSSGLKATTSEQGLTEYWANRISYCIAHPKYPRLFVWVYRHEGKKLKIELRCHAVLCQSESKAKAMAVQLHDKLEHSLKEFVRDKTRRQNTRLSMQRVNSLPKSVNDLPGVPLRRQILSQGQNFRPPVERSSSAPKLLAISEDQEPDIMEEEEDEYLEEVGEEDCNEMCINGDANGDFYLDVREGSSSLPDLHRMNSNNSDGDMFDLEIGNDVEDLKQDPRVQYHLKKRCDESGDDTSTESGFSEQEVREITSSSSSCGSDSIRTTSSEHLPEELEDNIISVSF